MNTLFTITLLELFFGGGGRLLEVGPVTVRMILFATCLCVAVVGAIKRLNADEGIPLALGFVVTYLLVHVLALLIGLFNGFVFGEMMQEMQQSAYWLIAPFFAMSLNRYDMVVRVGKLVAVAGVVLSIAYICVLLTFAIGAIDYLTLYVVLNSTGEFVFRSGGFFFYKGFLYLGVAAIFFLSMPKRFSSVWLTIVLIALALTLTRGFVLATSFAALLLLAKQGRWRTLGIMLAVIACLGVFLWGYMPSQDEALAVSRESSNGQRVDDFVFFVDNFEIGTILVGHGFGTLINGRSNIENTFLWAFWRFGLVGVAFWLSPLIFCYRYFARIGKNSPDFRLACAYFFSTVFIYVQTMSNPYLNNPIGLSFVMLAMFSLRTLSRQKPVVRVSAASPGATMPDLLQVIQ